MTKPSGICWRRKKPRTRWPCLTKTKENPFGTPRFAVSAAMSCWADELEMAGRRLDSGYVETRYEGDVQAR